jgi:hypothetical protein
MRKTKESIESIGMGRSIRWIRFESYRRFHAVFTCHWGLYWTYCGRCIRPEGVRNEDTKPSAVCGCCRSRIIRPYLIPAKIAKLNG